MYLGQGRARQGVVKDCWLTHLPLNSRESAVGGTDQSALGSAGVPGASAGAQPLQAWVAMQGPRAARVTAGACGDPLVHGFAHHG
jgi:hypothetical protein